MCHSIRVTNDATDRFGFWIRDGTIVEDGSYRIVEIVSGWGGALATVGLVQIVDATVVERLAMRVDDHRFRSYFRADSPRDLTARIEHNRPCDSVLKLMFAGRVDVTSGSATRSSKRWGLAQLESIAKSTLNGVPFQFQYLPTTQFVSVRFGDCNAALRICGHMLEISGASACATASLSNNCK